MLIMQSSTTLGSQQGTGIPTILGTPFSGPIEIGKNHRRKIDAIDIALLTAK